jgi:hypothetical protein
VRHASNYFERCVAREHEANRVFCSVASFVGEALIPDYYGKNFTSTEGTYIGRKKGIAQYSATEVAAKLLPEKG